MLCFERFSLSNDPSTLMSIVLSDNHYRPSSFSVSSLARLDISISLYRASHRDSYIIWSLLHSLFACSWCLLPGGSFLRAYSSWNLYLHLALRSLLVMNWNLAASPCFLHWMILGTLPNWTTNTDFFLHVHLFFSFLFFYSMISKSVSSDWCCPPSHLLVLTFVKFVRDTMFEELVSLYLKPRRFGNHFFLSYSIFQ